MRIKGISKKTGRFSVLFLAVLVVFVIMPAVSHGAQKHKEMRLTIASYIPPGYPYVYEGQKKLFVDMVNKNGKGDSSVKRVLGRDPVEGQTASSRSAGGNSGYNFSHGRLSSGVISHYRRSDTACLEGHFRFIQGIKDGYPSRKPSK